MGPLIALTPDSVHSGTSVEIIDQLRDLEALRPQWTELLGASATHGPFLTWEWVYAWWTHLRERSRLNLLVVRLGGQLVAIAPLRITRRPLTWFSSLEFLGTGSVGSDYLDLIVRRGCEGVAIDAMTKTIESQGLALRLSHLPPGSLAVATCTAVGAPRLDVSGSPVRCVPGHPPGRPHVGLLPGQPWVCSSRQRSPSDESGDAGVRRPLRTGGLHA